jgi:hypothetical protein
MPRGDGTGPMGQGPRSGRGMGGAGMGSGTGRGRLGGSRPGSGIGGYCICPQCGAKVSHQQSAPCYSINCPQCGTKMIKQ